MTNTVTNPTGLAREVERLRELVLDLGDAVARLTAELGAVKARLRTLEGALALPAEVATTCHPACCGAADQSFRCEEAPGHLGDHRAYIDGQVVHRWPARSTLIRDGAR